MKRQAIAALGMLVMTAAFSGRAPGVTLLDAGYKAEVYAAYESTTMQRWMNFDGAGNLYICHTENNKIMKIDTNGVPSTFVSGISQPFDIVWGGGTAYGDYLYATSRMGPVYRITSAGSWSTFSGASADQAIGMAIDRNGSYGGKMYVATTNTDHIRSISSTGTSQVFDHWLTNAGDGLPIGIDFDPSGKYGNAMFVGTNYPVNYASQSGLFQVSTSGYATRFSSQIEQCTEVKFDPYGILFNQDMFAIGKGRSEPSYTKLYRVDPSGNAVEFLDANLLSLTFGPDGAMYVAEFGWDTGPAIVTISRITPIPEPAALSLVALGMALLRRRRNTKA
jgi:hypothetical protein